MKPFHAIIRPLGDTRMVVESIGKWSGENIPVCRVADGSSPLARQGFGFEYETLESRLAELPRLYIEPDGSFAWVSSSDAAHRISGQITDNGRHVLYLELRGMCNWRDLSRVVLERLGWPEIALAFQLMPESLLVEEQLFRDVICGE